jgi:hypothetical protein
MSGGIEQSNPKENECSSSGAGMCLQNKQDEETCSTHGADEDYIWR